VRANEISALCQEVHVTPIENSNPLTVMDETVLSNILNVVALVVVLRNSTEKKVRNCLGYKFHFKSKRK
jgi:hypothetical protein